MIALLLKIEWPKDSRRKVKLKRALFGYKLKHGPVMRVVKGRFDVVRVKRGLIKVSDIELDSLLQFLDNLGISYKLMNEVYLISGPLALIKNGVNAVDKSYFRYLADEEAVLRSRGKYAGLEDAIASTFDRALKGKDSWLGYLVMALLIRDLEWHYLIMRIREFGVLDEFSQFISLVSSVLGGELRGNILYDLYNISIRYGDIVSIFRSLHWEIPVPLKGVKEFRGLTPKSIVSLASKQLFYG